MITLNSIYPVLKRLFGIRSIGVFGRIAHGEELPDGVIELLTDFTPAMESYEAYSGLCAFLEEKFGQEVRLVTARMLETQPVPSAVPEQPIAGDESYLVLVILDECVAIHEQCRDQTYSRFSRNEGLRQAITTGLDRAGLAAASLPEAFRALHSGVDWDALVILRRRLIRNPYGVDSAILWSAVHESIPGIAQRVRDLQSTL